MTHPLTAEICEELSSCITTLNAGDADPYISPFDVECDMQRAADWQLEQVIEWLRKNLPQTLYLEPIGYIEYKKEDRLRLIDDFKKAMRPTTTQEDN